MSTFCDKVRGDFVVKAPGVGPMIRLAALAGAALAALPCTESSAVSRAAPSQTARAAPRAGARRLLVADADAARRAQDEAELQEMTSGMMLGPVPILWEFSKTVGASVQGWVAAAVGSSVASREERAARRAAEDAVRAAARAEEDALALRRACRDGRPRAIQRLVRAGAEVNARNGKDWQRWAPLHYAVAYGHVSATKTLLELGADVNMQDWDQWTPLHWAAYLGQPQHVKIAEQLVEQGAKLHETTWNGQTPRDLSCKYQHQTMATLLADEEARAQAGRPWWRRPRRARLGADGMRRDRERFLDALSRESFDPRLRYDNQQAGLALAREAQAAKMGRASGLVRPPEGLDSAEMRAAADRAVKLA